MATLGDGNLAGLSDATFMTSYWDTTKLMYQRLAIYDKAAVINFEPDFFGYVQRQAPGGDPTAMLVHVALAADCADLPDDATGFGRCLVRLGRTYAPKAVLGFSPSTWGANTLGEVIAFMNQIGVPGSDAVIMQTLDRDAGCFEAATESNCQRAGSGWYWSDADFQGALDEARQIHDGLGKPLLWWQTPLGVPSATPGGTTKHYRDNRVQYLFAHPGDFVAVGALGIVFGAGADNQTDITTDSGQFRTAAAAYRASPAALP
jgi:hypothetical protein